MQLFVLVLVIVKYVHKCPNVIDVLLDFNFRLILSAIAVQSDTIRHRIQPLFLVFRVLNAVARARAQLIAPLVEKDIYSVIGIVQVAPLDIT